MLLLAAIGCAQTNPSGTYAYVAEIKYGNKTMSMKTGDTLYVNSNGTYTMQTLSQKWTGSYTLKQNRIVFSPAFDGSNGVTKGIIERENITLKSYLPTTPGKFVRQ